MLCYIRALIEPNSSVTGTSSTVFNSPNGLSFLGLPVTDWITAFAGCAVAFFAVVTLWVDWSNRKRQSTEKQLEKLYNPMFEIMDQAVREQSPHDAAENLIRIDFDNSFRKLLDTFLSYGHYLKQEEHDKIKKLLLFPVDRGHTRTYHEKDFKDCLLLVTRRREKLRASLHRAS